MQLLTARVRRGAAGAIALLGILTTGAAAMSGEAPAAPICQPGAAVDYPLTAIVSALGMELRIAPMLEGEAEAFTDASAREARAIVLGALADAAPVERDVRLLGLLHWHTQGTIALSGLAFGDGSEMIDVFRAVLARNGAVEEASLLDDLRDAFAPWGDSQRARYARWSDGYGKTYPVTDRPLRALSERWRETARPLDTAVEAAERDPETLAMLTARRDAVDDDERLDHLRGALHHCLEPWDTVAEGDRMLARIPQPQRDLLLMDLLLLETGNGSTHQYFFNATGALVPPTAEIFDRLGLAEQAAALRKGMALYPDPYPRDTEIRRAIMAGWPEERDDALAGLTGWFDDGSVLDAMIVRAKESGLWPR